MVAPLITGLSGTQLTDEERRFYREVAPAGVILFRRNVVDGAQLRRLIESVREAVGRDDFLVLVDQEGGRVQRIKPPVAPTLPAAATYGALFARDPEKAKRAAFLVARLTAEDLRAFGITMNCAPVLDVPVGTPTRSSAIAPTVASRPRSSPWPKPSREACWPVVSSPSSSTYRATAAPTPTATSPCRS
jgi:beta-glucosidase-like glycosyl hydrolase